MVDSVSSILVSVKQTLGLAEDYDVFDTDVLMAINTALANLAQLGVGPSDGFVVEDQDQEWDEVLDGQYLAMSKSYVYLQARLLFDPPTNPAIMQAYKEQLEQLAWRIAIAVEDNE